MEPPRSDDRSNQALLIADPLRFSLDAAVAKARSAIAEGEPVEATLGELVAEELTASNNSGRLIHILGIIEQLDCCQQIQKVRAALQFHPDSRVRSKAVLVLGRAGKNAEWILRRLLDPDARVQANAVQSVWGTDTPEIHKVFETAAKSPHSRVSVCGLIGLYLQGDTAAIGRLLAAAQHDSESFRLSARWAIGHTGDPRFLPFLNSVFRTDSPRCRGVTIGALARIRRSISAFEQAGRLYTEIISTGVEDSGMRRAELSVFPNGTKEPVRLTATQFVITEDGEPVTRYSAKPRNTPDILVSGFVIPRILSRADPYALAIEDALTACLRWKRTADLWCVDRYCIDDSWEQEEGLDTAAMHSEDPAVVYHLRRNRGFLTANEIIEKVIPGPGQKDLASRNVLASGTRVIEILSRAGGERHLFLCHHPDVPLSEEIVEELGSRAGEENIRLHGIQLASVQDTALQELVRQRCGGTYSVCKVEQVAARLAQIFRGLLNRYEIDWWPLEGRPAAQSTRVQIFSRLGCADCAIACQENGDKG